MGQTMTTDCPYRNGTVAVNIRKLLRDTDITLTELAQAVYPRAYSIESRRRRLGRISNGVSEPRLDEIENISKYFEVDPGDLAFKKYESWSEGQHRNCYRISK